MQLHLLHLDDALKEQSSFMDRCRQASARETQATENAALIRLWGKESALLPLQEQIASALKNASGETMVTFMGSGDFHHVSALLIGTLAAKSGEPFTVVHFDNHPDWVHCSDGMHCGSWVNRAMALPQVAKIVTIGVCSNDLKWPQFKGANLGAWERGKIVLLPWHSSSSRFAKDNIEHLRQEEMLATLDQHITTRNIYITIDKDVLSPDDAITNWDQGQMRLPQLLAIVRHLLTHHHAIGIDVNGDYSTPFYAGPWHHTALKKLEAMIDQPRKPPYKEQAIATNQASNLALLQCFSEAL